MEVITKQSKVDTIAEKWRNVYLRNGRWMIVMNDQSSGDIYNQLLKAKTEKEIVKIIGNTSWTECKCYECKKDNDAVISFDDGDECSIDICLSCLRKAERKIKK